MDDVAKVNIYMKDLENFGAMNSVYCEFFAAPFPARCCVQVADLPNHAEIEIEAIVVRHSVTDGLTVQDPGSA
jgi:2-iminobutanoate/2-iminopropanoate deaminase